jgi:hypothetical protein
MIRDIDRTPAIEKKHKATTDGKCSGLIYRTTSQPSKPDRTTVFPADATGVTKMSTWLTVNTECVVDPECFR